MSLLKPRKKSLTSQKEGELEAAVGKIAPNLRKMIETIIEENMKEFESGTNEISAYVSRLSTNEGLTDHEIAHREIMISGLALIKKMEQDPSRAPIKGVLRGDVPVEQKPASQTN